MPADPTQVCDDLDRGFIESVLGGTIFNGRFHHFRTIDSTNTYALEQARLGAPHGSFYVADEQTAGRGRSDHKWHSAAAAGLYLSVLVRPEIAASDLVWLPLLAGLAAHRAIHEVTRLDVDVRWPNDLLIGPRKVGGILVEAQTSAEPGANMRNTTAVVIGIGINLHQRTFPPNLATEPTSLDLETGRTTSRQNLLIAILQQLHREISKIPDSFREIPARMATVSTWVQGRRVKVHGPQACAGITQGLDERGFLRVRTIEGIATILTGGLRAAD